MSNEVYGFADFVDSIPSAKEIALNLQELTGLGIVLIKPDELYNFTADYSTGGNSIVFMVTDRPESENATYLVDFEDYAPEAQIGLPTSGVQRLDLLVATIESLFENHGASRVCIALTDSSEIEEFKTVSRQLLRETLISDFENLAPPCCLYDINR